MRLMSDLDDIASRPYQTLRNRESGGQLVIFAGCPHDHGNAMAFDLDFQRLFGGQVIPVVGKGKRMNPPQGNFFDAAAK